MLSPLVWPVYITGYNKPYILSNDKKVTQAIMAGKKMKSNTLTSVSSRSSSASVVDFRRWTSVTTSSSRRILTFWRRTTRRPLAGSPESRGKYLKTKRNEG